MNVTQWSAAAGVEPMLDQAERYGLPRRQQRTVRGEIGAREPARVLQFLIPQPHLGAQSMRGEPKHQRGREGPGLRGVIFDAVDFDACLLKYLARNRILEGFSR